MTAPGRSAAQVLTASVLPSAAGSVPPDAGPGAPGGGNGPPAAHPENASRAAIRSGRADISPDHEATAARHPQTKGSSSASPCCARKDGAAAGFRVRRSATDARFRSGCWRGAHRDAIDAHTARPARSDALAASSPARARAKSRHIVWAAANPRRAHHIRENRTPSVRSRSSCDHRTCPGRSPSTPEAGHRTDHRRECRTHAPAPPEPAPRSAGARSKTARQPVSAHERSWSPRTAPRRACRPISPVRGRGPNHACAQDRRRTGQSKRSAPAHLLVESRDAPSPIALARSQRYVRRISLPWGPALGAKSDRRDTQ